MTKYDHFLLGGNFARYYPKLQTIKSQASSDLISDLIKQDKKFHFVSNNDILNRKQYLEEIKHNFSEDIKSCLTTQHMMTSSFLSAQFIRANFPDLSKVRIVGHEGI